MMRDVNPASKSHSKPHHFVGEQPRKACDKSSKYFSKKSHAYKPMFDADDSSRDRHSYHRASTKNITRELLQASQF